jgi:hypothetical protein
MFKPLSTAYSQELSDFMFKSMGFTSLTKRDFFRLFQRAWDSSFTEKNILKAFKTCGLAPFDPEVILRKFKDKKAA